MIRAFLLVALCSVTVLVKSQSTVSFTPIVNGLNLKIDSTYTIGNQNFKVSQLRFYISNIITYKNGNAVSVLDPKNYLIDLKDDSSMTIPISNPKVFDKLSFLVGIDSVTNVTGALNGALDPTKGMYWTWQSGYINFKLEGTSSNSLEKFKAFEFHLGGYLPPFQTVQTVELSTQRTNKVQIVLDIGKFLQLADVSQSARVMSPGYDSKRLSQILSTCFSVYE